MDNNVKVTWIDDDAYTGEARGEIEILESGDLAIRMVGPHEIDNWDHEYTDDADMFLVDYKLGNHSPEGHPAYRFSGVALATKLRAIAKRPSVPIYLVSRIIENGHQNLMPELVDRCIPRRDLSVHAGGALLYYDALDYKLIGSAEKNSIEALGVLLKAPEEDFGSVLSALPKSLKKSRGLVEREGNSIESTPSEIVFGKWVIFSLLGVPGITYDDLYTATYLGIDVDYFIQEIAEKLEQENKSVQYSGVFSRTTHRRWWKQCLTNHIVSKTADDVSFTKTWLIAPEIYDVPDDKRSKCFVCGRPHPETVAIDPHDKEERRPVHIRCSEVDIDIDVIFPFEATRVIKED